MRIVKETRRRKPPQPRRSFPLTRGEQQTGPLVMMQILALDCPRNQPDLPIDAVYVPRRFVPAENAEHAELLVDGRAVEGGKGDGGGEEEAELAREEGHCRSFGAERGKVG